MQGMMGPPPCRTSLSVAKVGGIEDPELLPIDPELLPVEAGVQPAEPELPLEPPELPPDDPELAPDDPELPLPPESAVPLELPLSLGVCGLLLQAAAGDKTATRAATATCESRNLIDHHGNVKWIGKATRIFGSVKSSAALQHMSGTYRT
jgi:hypothetical protein